MFLLRRGLFVCKQKKIPFPYIEKGIGILNFFLLILGRFRRLQGEHHHDLSDFRP